MTLCPINSGHCVCQPDEGVPCPATRPKFSVGAHVFKHSGSYQAYGTIKALFQADDGSWRYVFRFDRPAGLLHIFSEEQLL